MKTIASFPLNMTLFIVLALISSCTQKAEKAPGNRPLLGAGFGIASVTLVVQNLDSARNYYTKVLGFNLPEPKKFKKGNYDGTLAAAVNLPDLSSLELMSVIDTALVAKKHPFITAFWQRHEGVRLYALSTSSVDTTRQLIQSHGFKTDTVQAVRSRTEKPKGWSWDDGGPDWKSLEFNRKNPPAHLPGFSEWIGAPYGEIQADWKPYTWRKYYENQPNGVVGMSSLLIVVDTLRVARSAFKIMGFTELVANDSLARFKIAHNQELQLTAPRQPGDAWSRFLQTRGPGVYAVRFEVVSGRATHDFLKKGLPAKALLADSLSKHITVLKEYAHGVQLKFTEESKQQAQLAKIYSFKEGTKLNTASVRHASVLYAKYCALCHGKNREGYVADYAPSLRSHALMAATQLPRSNYNYLRHTIAYGRAGTAMAPYAKSQGGPMDEDDIDLLIQWLHEQSGVKKPVELAADPVAGDAALGKTLYAKHCAACHGTNGEGISAPALGNPMLLATASDAFLRYTISGGRDSTPMPAFKDSLSKTAINALTTYLRSRASGWNAPAAVTVTEPLPADYVINPTHKAPVFTLRDGSFVAADQLLKAYKDSSRMVILDARSKAAWQQTHIPGAVSVPYYEEPDKFVKNIPNDSTLIVVYCACPHAASMEVVNTLKRFGYKHTAILDEGILVWVQRGYPVQSGGSKKKKSKA